MANLKELRSRMTSVKSTKKITSAMKMIAAAKLKKAQDQVESNRPYSNLMADMIGSLIEKAQSFQTPPPLLMGRGRYETYLLVALTSDRGLCGGFNGNVVKHTAQLARDYISRGKQVKIFCVGNKGRELLRTEFGNQIIDSVPALDKPTYDDAKQIGVKLVKLFEGEEFDVAQIVHNEFKSAIDQEVITHQIIPFDPQSDEEKKRIQTAEMLKLSDLYLYEPSEEVVFNGLLPKNVKVQIYRALLENAASEHGARMTAMDGATRNASDMIDKLQLKYNRTRQAMITTEIIEIVSGADAQN